MKVKFLPSGEEYEIEANETILHLAQRQGLYIQSVCKGIPSCAECRVQLVEGEHHVLPPSKKELNLIGTAHYVDLSRLSCQLRCFGDVTVDLSEQVEKEKKVNERQSDLTIRSDGEKSKAVLGGIFDNAIPDNTIPTDTTPPEKKPEKEKSKIKIPKGKSGLDKRDAFYGNFYTEENKKREKTKFGKNKQKNSRSNRSNPSNQKAKNKNRH